MRLVEAASYRLAPDDEVLEREVHFENVVLWVPVTPSSPAHGEGSAVSWRKWLFDYCHKTFVDPHRTQGETWQILKRCGYWDSMSPDFSKWYYQCEECQRTRSMPVAAPTRSTMGDDSLRRKLPWSDVIVDVQGPYTTSEGGRCVPALVPLCDAEGTEAMCLLSF